MDVLSKVWNKAEQKLIGKGWDGANLEDLVHPSNQIPEQGEL